MLLRRFLQPGLLALVLGLGLSLPARAGVVATAGGYEISYRLNLAGTLNGNPVTSIVILETDGTELSVASGFTAAGTGKSRLSHTISFLPTAALVIGLDLAVPGLGDGKTHLVMLLDAVFADALDGKKFSEAFPAVGGQPRLGHDALVAAILGIDAGDADALDTVTDFFVTGAGAFGAFDPAGGFRVGEFSFFDPIDVPEPAGALLLLSAVTMLAVTRRRRGQG